MWNVDLLGYLAGIFLILMASMQTQFYMRLFNIAGNSSFILYGWLAEIWPVLILNTVMLGIHLYRIVVKKPAEVSTRHQKRDLRTVH